MTDLQRALESVAMRELREENAQLRRVVATLQAGERQALQAWATMLYAIGGTLTLTPLHLTGVPAKSQIKLRVEEDGTHVYELITNDEPEGPLS